MTDVRAGLESVGFSIGRQQIFGRGRQAVNDRANAHNYQYYREELSNGRQRRYFTEADRGQCDGRHIEGIEKRPSLNYHVASHADGGDDQN